MSIKYFECFLNDTEAKELDDIKNNKYNIKDNIDFGIDYDTIWRLRLLSLKSIIIGKSFEASGSEVYKRDFPISDGKSFRHPLSTTYIVVVGLGYYNSTLVSIEESEYNKLIEYRKILHDKYFKRIVGESINKDDALKYLYIDGLKYIYRLRKEEQKKKKEDAERLKIEAEKERTRPKYLHVVFNENDNPKIYSGFKEYQIQDNMILLKYYSNDELSKIVSLNINKIYHFEFTVDGKNTEAEKLFYNLNKLKEEI